MLSAWTVPADWNQNDNTVECIGGGGGGRNGATVANAGAGGGGGGYSKITNLAVAPGASIAYTVGAAGAAGAPGTAGCTAPVSLSCPVWRSWNATQSRSKAGRGARAHSVQKAVNASFCRGALLTASAGSAAPAVPARSRIAPSSGRTRGQNAGLIWQVQRD